MKMDESLKSILEMYKDGTITIEETLGLIEAISGRVQSAKEASPGLPWEDDRKMRIVAYIGRKIIKKGDESSDFSVVFEGNDPLNVECWGSLCCGEICGNASSGSNMECGDIGGNATAGTHINCGDIGGNATAGSSVNAGDIGGNTVTG
jgi:hypothetical protein